MNLFVCTFELFILLMCCASSVVSAQRFQPCTDDNEYCNNDGLCYQDTKIPKTKFCSCDTDFHGDRCQSKVDGLFEKLVIALAVLCVLLLIGLIASSYVLHSKSSEYEDYKLKVSHAKKEEERRKKRQKELLKPRSRQASASSAGSKSRSRQVSVSSNGSKSPTGSHKKEDFLFDITATGIERSQSFKNMLDQEDSAVVIEIDQVDLNDRKLSTVEDVRRLSAQPQGDRLSVSSASVEGTNNSKRVHGRPSSWAGPTTEDPEDLNKIYNQYYLAHSDDEGSGNEFDERGYRKRKGDSSRPQDDTTLKVGNLQKFNQMGKARSMTDLRILAMQGQKPQKARSETNLRVHGVRSARSVENIHTGQITLLTPHPRKSPGQQRKQQKKGIYAREMERKLDSPYH